ncbi:CBR-GAP-1 protein [Aphelenchoides avenae]|nr:CBR-GAP-1 protein [Aphelenchus avenae]
MSVECSHAPASSNCSAAVAAAACTDFEAADAVEPCVSEAEPSDEDAKDAHGSSDHDDVEQDENADAVRDVLRRVVDRVACDGDGGGEGPSESSDANNLPKTNDRAVKASPPPATDEATTACVKEGSLAPPLLSPIPMDDLESSFSGSLPATPMPFGMSSEQAILAQLRKFHGPQELEDDENGNVEKVTERTTTLALTEDKENANTTGGSLPSIAHGDRSSTSSLECLDEKRRIPAIKLAPVPGRKPTKPGRRKTKMPPPPPLVWAATPQPLTPPPRSPTAASSLPRRIELLKGSIPQLRNLRCSPRSTLTVHVKMDTQDVYQTFSLPSSSSCVINDEFKHELPPNFNALHFVVAETTDGCSTRPLGRVTIRRKDLVEQAMMDQWLPIMPFSKTQTTEIVGDLCLDVDADPAQRTVAIR